MCKADKNGNRNNKNGETDWAALFECPGENENFKKGSCAADMRKTGQQGCQR